MKMRATRAEYDNARTWKILFDKWRLIACSAFEWDGLPGSMTSRHIERLLFDQGKAVFFRDPLQSYMCLEVTDAGQHNVYDDPLLYRATGFKYTKEIRAEDCVIIENNLLRIPTRPTVDFYVDKMSEIERTMDVNVKAVKTPTIFACNDRDVLTFKRIFQQVDGNVPAIFADKNLSMEDIASYDTKAQFLCNDLQDYKKTVENELLTFLGLNNVSVDKKERLITDEAQANDQLIQSFIDMQLDARTEAAARINDMFGLSVSVKKRTICAKPVDNSGEGGDNE